MKRSALVAVLLAVPHFAFAAGIHWGLEVGGNYSALDRRSAPLANEERDARMLPSIGITAERALGSRWGLAPAIRYVQEGEKSTWNYLDLTGGHEESREHVLSAGLGIRCKLAGPAFVSMSPELTYLLAASLKQYRWRFGETPLSDEVNYATASDRWNGAVRAGLGSKWAIAGGTGVVSLRYVRGIADMGRTVSPLLFPLERNIAWYTSPQPKDVSKWRTEAVELVAGFEW